MLSKHWLPHLDLRAENSPPPGHLVARAGLEPLPEFPAPCQAEEGSSWWEAQRDILQARPLQLKLLPPDLATTKKGITLGRSTQDNSGSEASLWSLQSGISLPGWSIAS